METLFLVFALNLCCKINILRGKLTAAATVTTKYKGNSGKVTYDEARSLCEQQGGKLAEFSEDQDVNAHLLYNTLDLPVGAQFWVDVPSYMINTRCTYLSMDQDPVKGELTATNCSKKMGYICQQLATSSTSIYREDLAPSLQPEVHTFSFVSPTNGRDTEKLSPTETLSNIHYGLSSKYNLHDAGYAFILDYDSSIQSSWKSALLFSSRSEKFGVRMTLSSSSDPLGKVTDWDTYEPTKSILDKARVLGSFFFNLHHYVYTSGYNSKSVIKKTDSLNYPCFQTEICGSMDSAKILQSTSLGSQLSIKKVSFKETRKDSQYTNSYHPNEEHSYWVTDHIYPQNSLELFRTFSRLAKRVRNETLPMLHHNFNVCLHSPEVSNCNIARIAQCLRNCCSSVTHHCIYNITDNTFNRNISPPINQRKIDDKMTSRHIRRLSSAPDSRQSSKAMGIGAVLIIGTIVLCIVSMDVPRVIIFFKAV